MRRFSFRFHRFFIYGIALSDVLDSSYFCR